MATFNHIYCSACNRQTVHENGVCMGHEEVCDACECGIKSDQGRYRLNPDKTFCERCGDLHLKQVKLTGEFL